MSADSDHVYVSNAFRFPSPENPPGGIAALNIADGSIAWRAAGIANKCAWGNQGCSPAQSQAVSNMPGVVFSGSLDGYLRAYASADGKILWEFDTGVDFKTVNGIDAKGGSLDGAGPTIADGAVYVLSGYGRLGGHGGNALIAFTPEGK